jgi:hypothetical protein
MSGLKKKNKTEAQSTTQKYNVKTPKSEKNHGRCQNRQLENKHFVKIVTTHRLHSQPHHGHNSPTLFKVNI